MTPRAPLLVVGGGVVGAASWWLASVVSGAFEPYDSHAGLLVNQVVLTGVALLVSCRYNTPSAVLALIGAYLGLQCFSYLAGWSETRAWALLGAVTSLLLFLIPVVAIGVCAAVSLWRSRVHDAPRKET